jgi:toxin secretion/phage lysis holin
VEKGMFAAIEHQMEWFRWVLAGAGAMVAVVPDLVWLLLGLMVADIIFGFAAAWNTKDVSPTAMWSGVTKKLLSLGVVTLAAFIDQYIDLLGIDLVQVTTLFYIGPEFLSIIRNAAIAGVPVPPQFVEVLRYFQNPDDKKTK